MKLRRGPAASSCAFAAWAARANEGERQVSPGSSRQKTNGSLVFGRLPIDPDGESKEKLLFSKVSPFPRCHPNLFFFFEVVVGGGGGEGLLAIRCFKHAMPLM